MHITHMATEYAKAINSQLVKRELKQVKNSLADFEKRHKMSSDEFFEKFNAGKLGDDREYIKWYAYKDTFNKLMGRLKEIETVVHA